MARSSTTTTPTVTALGSSPVTALDSSPPDTAGDVDPTTTAAPPSPAATRPPPFTTTPFTAPTTIVSSIVTLTTTVLPPATAPPTGTGTTTPTYPPPTSPTTPAQAPARVTSGDAGRTYRLARGQLLVVELLGDQQGTWSDLSSSDIDVLQSTSAVRRGDGDAMGSFVAGRPGEARLSAVKSPACGQATPACQGAALLFEVTVVVT